MESAAETALSEASLNAAEKIIDPPRKHRRSHRLIDGSRRGDGREAADVCGDGPADDCSSPLLVAFYKPVSLSSRSPRMRQTGPRLAMLERRVGQAGRGAAALRGRVIHR